VKNSLFAAAALSVLSISAAAHAEVVAGYDFTGYTGNEPAGTVTAFDPNVTVSDAVRGAGFESPGTLAGDPRDVNAIGVYPLDTNVYYDTVDDNTSASEYLTFSLTPTAGSSMSLTQLVFTGDIQNGAGTIPDSLGMSYSTDGMDFTTAAGTITGGTGAQGSALIDTFPVVIADDTGPIYFRLFLLGNGTQDGGTAGNNFEIGGFGQHASSATMNTTAAPYDIEVDGTVTATPEPAALGLLSIAAIGLIRRRRRA
jgi:MYXO-CTERM domain-containing protein